MRTMNLNDKYFGPVMAGLKVNTIRLGDKQVSLGRLGFDPADNLDLDSIGVEVFAVVKKYFCDLDENDAQGGGYTSKHEMIREIQEIYKLDIAAFAPMTVVWFTYTPETIEDDCEDL